MAIEIRMATDSADIRAIQRQRYEVYVDELRYPQAHACHVTRTIAEPLDARAVLFGAFDADQIVGSVRLVLGRECPSTPDSAPSQLTLGRGPDDGFAEYTALYGLKRFAPWYPSGLCIVTKLMVSPRHRGGTLLARLSLALYRYLRDFHPAIRFSVIDCIPTLEPYFLRLGYRAIGPLIAHPAAGPVVPMAFPLYDRKHLLEVRSPFFRACPRHDEESSDWFRRRFLEACQAICMEDAT